LKFAILAKPRGMEMARELLLQFGLGDKLHQEPKELSPGEKQRVAIARGLGWESSDPSRRRANGFSRRQGWKKTSAKSFGIKSMSMGELLLS